MRTFIVLALALAGSAVHAEQSVFKCTKADGSAVFSPTPCGSNAKQIDTSGALRSGTSPNVQGISDRAAVSAIDGECKNRERGIFDESNRELAMVDVEVKAYRREMAISANNYAGATRDNGIRGQIEGAEQRRQELISRRDADLNALAHSCDDRRAAELHRQAARDGQTPGQSH